jgi:hypothetical protein
MVNSVNLKTPAISDSQLQRMVIRDTSNSALDRFTAGEADFTGKLPSEFAAPIGVDTTIFFTANSYSTISIPRKANHD